VCQGRLQHAYLKRDQGIRKAFQNTTFEARRAHTLILLLYFLDKYARENFPGETLLTIANATWQGIVKKRDWKADPEAGGGHTHHDLEAPPTFAQPMEAPVDPKDAITAGQTSSANLAGCDRDGLGRQPDNPDYGKVPVRRTTHYDPVKALPEDDLPAPGTPLAE
jgi:hypothetical protein